MNKLFRYAGAKDKYIDIISKHINRYKKGSIYIEPFLGSGAIFLNIEDKFDSYIINDLDSNIIRIFKSVKEGDYSDFLVFYEDVLSKFGDIKKDKNAFYAFRNRFNEKLWKTDTIFEGFGLLMLYSSCINSLARFGPNGFNQSYGNRLYKPSQENWNEAKIKLNKTTIYNTDFITLMNNLDSSIIDNSLMFLDPPYFYGGDAGYKNLEEPYFREFIKYIEKSKAAIVYTDVKHEDLSNKWSHEIIRTMQNISPNRKSEYTDQEALFFNF